MEPTQSLDMATLQALVWTFGSIISVILTAGTGFVILLLWRLSHTSAEHGIRLYHLEDHSKKVHELLFPEKYDVKRKKE